MRNFGIRLGFCLALLWPACGFADDATPVIKATPALWTVHGAKGNTVYLLGSFHALPKNVDWQTPQITAAMKAANTFVFEVPMDADDRKKIGLLLGENELLPISTSLPSMFASQMRADYHQAVKRIPFGLGLIVYLRPWRASQMLQQAMISDAPYYSEEGVDNRVYAMANARGVTDPRIFETGEFQVHVILRDVDPTTEFDQLTRYPESLLVQQTRQLRTVRCRMPGCMAISQAWQCMAGRWIRTCPPKSAKRCSMTAIRIGFPRSPPC